MYAIAIFAMLLLVQAAGAARTGDGVIAGQLRKPDGTPAAGVRVGVVSVGERSAAVESLISLSETDREGRYRLDQVPPGRYLLIAGPLDTPAYYPGVGSLEEATVITLEREKPLGPFDFKIGVGVTGRIVDETGAGLRVDGSALSLEDGRGAKTRARQSADSTFEFRNAWPGRYWLTVDSVRLREITIADKDLAGLLIVVSRSALPLHRLLTCQGGSGLTCFDGQRLVTLEGVVKQFDVRKAGIPTRYTTFSMPG